MDASQDRQCRRHADALLGEITMQVVDGRHRLVVDGVNHVAVHDALAVTYGAHAEEGLRACQPLHCLSTVHQLREWLTANA